MNLNNILLFLVCIRNRLIPNTETSNIRFFFISAEIEIYPIYIIFSVGMVRKELSPHSWFTHLQEWLCLWYNDTMMIKLQTNSILRNKDKAISSKKQDCIVDLFKYLNTYVNLLKIESPYLLIDTTHDVNKPIQIEPPTRQFVWRLYWLHRIIELTNCPKRVVSRLSFNGVVHIQFSGWRSWNEKEISGLKVIAFSFDVSSVLIVT